MKLEHILMALAMPVALGFLAFLCALAFIHAETLVTALFFVLVLAAIITLVSGASVDLPIGEGEDEREI